MKHGYSLLVREYVEAREVDYDDCRSFQIVCPCCYEALFKAGSDPEGRQYLSHYASGGSDVPDCELRVASMSTQSMQERNHAARGQHLELFQKRFFDLLAAQFFADEAYRSHGLKLIDRMTSRPSYRSLIREIRPSLQVMAHDDVAVGIVLDPDVQYRSRSPFWRQRQKTYALSFLRHVVAPNSLRTLYFAVAMGVLHQRSTAMKLGTSGRHAAEGVRMLDMLIDSSDAHLRKWLEEIAEAPEEPSPASLLRVVIMQALRAALLEFPYLEAIRTAG